MTKYDIGPNDALLIIDVQNDFCPGGALGVPEGDQVIAPLNDMAREFLDKDLLVIQTRDWHPEVTPHFQKDGGIWPVHCVRDTNGAVFHPDLLQDPRIVVASKGTGTEDSYSGFDAPEVLSNLKAKNVKRVWVGGLATDYCVKATVLDAIQNGYEAIVLGRAIRAVDLNPGDGEKAILEMHQAGATISYL